MAYLQSSGKNSNSDLLRPGILLIIAILCYSSAFSQDAGKDYGWWNILHGWDIGDPNWRSWLIISPGYLGPNALPVPEVKKGIVDPNTELDITFSSHHFPGDPTQDISGRVYIPFANHRIAVELYSVLMEKFSYTEEIRNERFSRDEDGKGIMFGDFYFSTLIQLVKDRKFPDMLLRLAGKTSTGEMHSARYTDSPGHYFDLSFSRNYRFSEQWKLRPFGSVGFYSWQTYDELNPQNDAFMYAAGTDLLHRAWLISASCSGYSGYRKEKDRPVQLNFELRKDLPGRAYKIQYLHGLRDWEYKTVRFSVIFKLDPVS